MDTREIERLLIDYVDTAAGNHALAGTSLGISSEGMKIFDAPLLGFGAADDPMFAELADPAVVSTTYRQPNEWLPGARTVISYFLPFTEDVRRSNRGNGEPSPEWMHGRIDGQAFVAEVGPFLVDRIEAAGGHALCPAVDARFEAVTDGRGDPLASHSAYYSNWSERHTAFICGLGTFSLSRGIITKKGMTGRFGSVICDLALPPTPRAYTELEEYCIHCGRCVDRCPVRAISLSAGKEHAPCHEMLERMKGHHAPYFGCGKCQCGVPCEAGIPQRGAHGACEEK